MSGEFGQATYPFEIRRDEIKDQNYVTIHGDQDGLWNFAKNFCLAAGYVILDEQKEREKFFKMSSLDEWRPGGAYSIRYDKRNDRVIVELRNGRDDGEMLMLFNQTVEKAQSQQ